jgi:uridine kinase
MFNPLILPLKGQRSIGFEVDLAEETAAAYHRHLYEFRDVDVIVLEGIYLLKRAFRPYYDLAFWVDCSFETALVRALRRGQEGLPPDETIRAYQTIYFPAQYIHFAVDDPRSSADAILVNNS